MRWVRVNYEGQSVFGVLDDQTITLTSLSWEEVLNDSIPDPLTTIALDDADLLVPMERPGKIIAIGQNYWDHCREQNKPAPERPIIFTKFTTSMNRPGGVIQWAEELTQQVDFEAELAVIIGQEVRNIPQEEALNAVFGYTVANDVSARDLQFGDKQWIRGKSLDTFCPMGPILVTADEIHDPQALHIRSMLNGVIMQESNTSEMIFPVAELIAFASQAFTLEPGDVILTGTPDGVGVFRDPPMFMDDGDRIVVEIGGIGRLENICKVD